MLVLNDLYLAINDLKAPDMCSFTMTFEHSLQFCDETWANVDSIEVPSEIQDTYPQFITIPELYKNDDDDDYAKVPSYYCDQLWNSSLVCC